MNARQIKEVKLRLTLADDATLATSLRALADRHDTGAFEGLLIREAAKRVIDYGQVVAEVAEEQP